MKQGISLPQIPKKLLDTDKDLYDYLFGLQQALLAKQTDDYSAVDKVSSGSVPIGTILMYAVATAPTNYLICDGSAISRTTYAGLFSVIGTAYGTGDGTTTFNLPNYQAVVPKGVGTQTINTRIKTGPAFAAVEEDQFQGFGLDTNDYYSGAVHYHAVADQPGKVGAPQHAATSDNTITGFFKNDGTNGKPRTGLTTRENSIGTNFIIRYQ